MVWRLAFRQFERHRVLAGMVSMTRMLTSDSERARSLARLTTCEALDAGGRLDLVARDDRAGQKASTTGPRRRSRRASSRSGDWSSRASADRPSRLGAAPGRAGRPAAGCCRTRSGGGRLARRIDPAAGGEGRNGHGHGIDTRLDRLRHRLAWAPGTSCARRASLPGLAAGTAASSAWPSSSQGRARARSCAAPGRTPWPAAVRPPRARARARPCAPGAGPGRRAGGAGPAAGCPPHAARGCSARLPRKKPNTCDVPPATAAAPAARNRSHPASAGPGTDLGAEHAARAMGQRGIETVKPEPLERAAGRHQRDEAGPDPELAQQALRPADGRGLACRLATQQRAPNASQPGARPASSSHQEENRTAGS